MSLIKSRNWTEKEDQDLLIVLKDLEEKSLSVTWRQISDLLKQRNPLSRKTGKQCRQRWANQLDPKIKRNENWTKAENQILFQVHAEVGNKWSSICSHLPGRTDNCIKNHFYSTMRRGMRKINSYIQNVKRKTTLTKTFKNEILNKILAICQGKNDNKYQFNNIAKQFALNVKNNLAILSIECSDQDQQNIEFKQQIFHQISQFSRNCRKKKSKKQSDLSDQEINHLIDEQAQKIQISAQPIKQVEKNLKIYQQQPKNKNTSIPLNPNTKNQKQIKIPLIQLKNPSQESNQKYQSVNMRKQILKKYQTLQKLNSNCQQKKFNVIVSNSINNIVILNNLSQENEDKCQNITKNNDKKQINCLNSFTDLSKIQSYDSFKVIDNRMFQMNQQPPNTKQIYKFIPTLIQSQDLTQNSTSLKKQSNTMTNIQYNSVTCLSPALPSFTIYASSFGFNYPSNWPLQQQTYHPFASMIQLGDSSQKYRQRSSFKIVKRSSLETQKTNSFNNS